MSLERICKNYDIVPGRNDLNQDGIEDALLFLWNGRAALFISNDGVLPWTEDRDWQEYFNAAYEITDSTWNEERKNWGNYVLLVDRDQCGYFDSPGDFYYKACDINHDGYPECELYHNYFGTIPHATKLHINFNGEHDMSNIKMSKFSYGDEQEYLPGGKYLMNVHGSGMFLQGFSPVASNAWENPIAWYDFDFDGFTNMVMRAADRHIEPPVLREIGDTYTGKILEFEVAFELNGNTSNEHYHSLDMQLTYYNYEEGGFSYSDYKDDMQVLLDMPQVQRFSERRNYLRNASVRCYTPYLDGYKIGSDCKEWAGVWMIFDEDDDDCRWEEMFSRHETYDNCDNDWYLYSDRIGDRIEVDSDFKGEGKLYVGRFDGKIHLYHAEEAFWDVDYFALFKGSMDRKKTQEGPEPEKGMRYPRIRYYDLDGDGFIDKIEYFTVAYGDEENTAVLQKSIDLSEYGIEPYALFDPRVDSPVTGFKVEDWDGNPLTAKDFENTSCKDGYDKMVALYTQVCEQMAQDALLLYKTAVKYGLNRSEGKDSEIRTEFSIQERYEISEYLIPGGYTRHKVLNTRREKYHNGFWLKEKVFDDILIYSKLDEFRLKQLFYTGRIKELCDYVEDNMTVNNEVKSSFQERKR